MKNLILILILLLLPTSAMAGLSASVSIVADQPVIIYPGGETRLQITLGNSEETSVISSVFFDTALPGIYPDGLKILSAATYECTDPATGITAAGAGELTAAVDSQIIKLTGGTIPARDNSTDGVCTIIIPVTAGTSTGSVATYDYEILRGKITGTIEDTDGNTVTVSNQGDDLSQTIGVRDLAKPTISKNFDALTIRIGDDATQLTFTVTNSNPVPIPNFSITDTFPTLNDNPIIKVAATPNATSSCNDGSVPIFAPVDGASSVTATGTIPAKTGSTNGSCTFSVDVIGVSTNGGYETGDRTNTIAASGDFTNSLGIPAEREATDDINVLSPLAVTKRFDQAVLSSGENGSFTITLRNDANAPLTISSFTDSPIDGIGGIGGGAGVLGSGLVATGGSTTCGGVVTPVSVIGGGDGIELTGSNIIPADGSCTISVDFTAAAQATQVPVTYINTLDAGVVNVGDAAIVSQGSSATVIVADVLRAVKSAIPSVAAPGNPVRYTITVQNFSATSISPVSVNDTLPTDFTYLTGTINGNDYSPDLTACGGVTESSSAGDSSAQFTIPSLPARTNEYTPGSCTVSFWAMVDPNAADNLPTTNTISAGDICYNDGALCNGSAVSSTPATRTEATVMLATKRFNGTTDDVTLSEGTIATLSVTYTNISANPLTNITLSDTFPIDGTGQLQVANPANASTTCGGTITATPGTSSLALNGATVPARATNGTGANGSCVVNVDVIGPAGDYPNVAQVAATQTYANGTTALISPFTTNTARLIYLSSLTAVKDFTPGSISSGGTSRVTVRLANSGAVALTNIAVTDPLPAGMVLASPVNASSTCAGTPTFTSATAGSSSLVMQGASIAGNGSCDVLFDVIATGSSNWINTIPSGNITADGGVRNVAPVSATLNYLSPTAISVAKATNPSTLTFPGQTSELTLSFTNGNLAVTSMAVTDYFTQDGTSGAAANGMAIAATPNASTTCPGGVVSAVSGGSEVSVSGVSLNANESCSVKVNVTSSAVGGISNFIPIGAITTDQGLSNGGQASTSLTTQSNIGVVKSFTPKVVKPGERSRLRITFYNPTAQPMANISVLDTLPAGVTVPSGANPTSTCSGATVTAPVANQVQISGGNIVAATDSTAASCSAEIDVIVTAEGDYTNTIEAGGVTGTAGGVAVNNSEPTSDTLFAKTPLVIHKAFDGKTLDSGNPVGLTTEAASVLPGATSTLTVRLDNPNSQDLTGASLTDSLPENLVVAQTPNASTTCTGGFVDALASASTIRLTGATIPANGFCSVSVDVLSNISGSYVNAIPSATISTNEGVTNEEPTNAQLIVSTPPGVDKQFAPAVISTGGTSTLTIVFSNDNSSATALSSVFVDSLPTAPGNILVATNPNVIKTCPGTVTASAGASSISYANGASIPAGGCTISVDVTGNTVGEHINNIPAGDLKTSVGNNQQAANSSLIISPLGYISGKVFEDNDVTPNGLFDIGTDTPVAGVSIELHAGSDCSASLVSIAGVTNPLMTDSLGNYLFANLPADTYSVCQPTQPSGTNNGTTTSGAIVSNNGSTGTPGTASNPTTTSSQIIGIVLNGDGGVSEISGSTNNNFAEIVPSSISGAIFLDLNNNGEFNGTDTPLIGVSVDLLDNSSSLITSVLTDVSGSYSFNGLAPGTYSVREPNQPSGTSSGLTVAGAVANGGTAGTVTDPATVPSQITAILLPPNTSAANNNFAEIPNSRRISGTLFLDYDNSGTINGSDHGIGSQTITLSGADVNGNLVSISTTTANDGSYSFTPLPEGTYTLDQLTQPTGTTNGTTTVGSTDGTASAPTTTSSRIANIDLTGTNTVSGGNDFAEVPGAAVDLAIAKTHSPASLGDGSSTGFYTISPRNIGTLDTSGTITIVDTLPVGITSVAMPNNSTWSCSGSGQVVACTSTTVIAAGATGTEIILRVAVANGLAGQLLTNTAVISGGDEPPGFDGNNSDSDPTAISQSASVEGHVWRDNNHDRVMDSGEPKVPNWIVELILENTTVGSTTTDSSGAYIIPGIAPGSGYQILFRSPDSGAIYGRPVPNESSTVFTAGVISSGNPAGADNSTGILRDLTLLAGTNTVEQSLPLDPSGVIYDSITRVPVAGAIVSISGPATFIPDLHLLGGSANANQTTGIDGYYQFLLLSGAPSDEPYRLSVTPPPGYIPTPSGIIPVCMETPTVGLNPDPALVQSSMNPPQASAPLHDPATCPDNSTGFAASGNSTQYYSSFNLTVGISGDVVNNHIPVDPVLGGAITLVKTSPLVNVSIGQMVPYTITATNNLAADLSNIDIRDTLPPGFKYMSGSASVDGVLAIPSISGRVLSWTDLSFPANATRSVKLLLVVGAGVQPGEYINTVQAFNNLVPPPDNAVSNRATAVVRVIPDPVFDCSDVIGKVFDDQNANGYQDDGEPGIPSVRVATARGLLVTTDAEGRYHVTCAMVPNEFRGSNFIMKLDERTLPSGYRITTENPRAIHLTRGKMGKLNFGAAIHRVVRLEMTDAAFITDQNDLGPELSLAIDNLPEQLRSAPSIVRLAYNQQNETNKMIHDRLKEVRKRIEELWEEQGCCYTLVFEEEIFQRNLQSKGGDK